MRGLLSYKEGMNKVKVSGLRPNYTIIQNKNVDFFVVQKSHSPEAKSGFARNYLLWCSRKKKAKVNSSNFLNKLAFSFLEIMT